jgi:hypothetical protein
VDVGVKVATHKTPESVELIIFNVPEHVSDGEATPRVKAKPDASVTWQSHREADASL